MTLSTTIRVSPYTMSLLKEIGKKSETYDDILHRLINQYMGKEWLKSQEKNRLIIN